MPLRFPAYNLIILFHLRSNYLWYFSSSGGLMAILSHRQIANTFYYAFWDQKRDLSENSVFSVIWDWKIKSSAEEHSHRVVGFDFNLSRCCRITHCKYTSLIISRRPHHVCIHAWMHWYTYADICIQKHILAWVQRTAFNAFHGNYPSGWPIFSIFKT